MTTSLLIVPRTSLSLRSGTSSVRSRPPPSSRSVGHSTVVGSLIALIRRLLASPFIEEEELDAIGDAVIRSRIGSARSGTTSC